MPAGKVEVFLIGAVGIKDTEIFGKADPYAILICGKERLRSNTASNQGAKPIWNQKFSFYVDDRANDLQIKIYNHNIIKEDDELGSTIIPLAKVFSDGKLPTTSYNVVRPSGRVQGEVKLSISFTPKQRSSQQTIPEIPGPYNEKEHGSPYAPEPTVRHDPLKGPNGYFRDNTSTSASSHGSKPQSFSSNSNLGANRPYPPLEVSTYPPKAYPPVPSIIDPSQHSKTDLPYQRSGGFSSSSDGSSHGLHPVTPSTSIDYTGSVYVQSPYGHGYPHPTPPASLSSASRLGASSGQSGLPAYPPPGGPSPLYPSTPSTNFSHGGANQFQFDQLAGNFGSLKIYGNAGDLAHGSYSGYHRTQSASDNRPADGYPPSIYSTPEFASQYHTSHEEFPGPGSYSMYGYEAAPPSFYPQQLGVPEQSYGRTDAADRPLSSNAHPPAPYYNAPPAHYIPAGYPK